MKERIIKFVKENPYCTFGNISTIFDGRKNDLLILLNKLVDGGELIKEDDTFLTPYNLGLILGTVISVKQHYAFVRIFDSDEEVVVEEKYLHNAFLNDVVYLRYDVMFEVIKIVKRERINVVGEVLNINHTTYLDVNGITTTNTKFVVTNYCGKDGEILKAKIEELEDDIVYVSMIEKLGDKNAPGVDITRVLLEHDCPIEFNEDINSQVASLPLEVKDEEIQNRLDLRNELIVTIDGEDAKDLDDAVSVKKINNGFEIGVHIADVSYYVQENTPLDLEALNRGTSIYVADRVVPMLPFLLSNGICSLNPHVDRLTISCFISLDKEGNVISSKIYPSVINSKHRLTYTYVNEVIKNKLKTNELEENILLLDEVAKLLREKKRIRGELDLAIPETKVIVNDKGESIGLEKKIQQDGEKLIEDLMILANEQVAETINKMNLPFIYRIHENPPAKRMDTLLAFVSNIGLRSHFNSLNVKPTDLQKLLDDAKYSEKYQILAQILLRSLAKAKYSVNNKGHFGLASKCYTHFTSPIRRYPDLIVHRLLRKYLFDGNTKNARENLENLLFIADNTSMKERRAITVEREATDIKCAEYMRKFIGMEFKGYISGMTSSGLFVELDNGVSGKISFESMSDYYVLDKNSFHVYGRRKGKRYSLGNRLTVVVESTNKDAGEIILSIKDEKKHIGRYNRRKSLRRSY